MPRVANSSNYKVDLQRSKDEILKLKKEADESDTAEATIIAETIDWLFDSNAESPLANITDTEGDEDPDFEDFDEDDEEIDEDEDEFEE